MEHRKPIQAGNQRGLPASGLLYWIKRGRLGRLANSARTLLHRMLALVKIPPPDAPQLLQRIELMERDIILPLKAAGVAMLLYSFYFRPWIGRVLSALDIAVQSTQYLFWVYVAINLVVTVCDNAKESCPIFPRPVPRIHLPFHDPHGEPLESFIQVRDDIRARLIPAVVEALGLIRNQ